MILTALNDYYNRLIEQGVEDIAPYGYSYEGISYVLVVSQDGELITVDDIRDTSGKKPRAQSLCVPQPPKRSVNIEPCFLWDKTAYTLGLTLKDDEKSRSRAILTHDAFKSMHESVLAETSDTGLKALLLFLRQWQPDDFATSEYYDESIFDTNVVFRLEGDQGYIHEREAAKLVRHKMLATSDGDEGMCLISGATSSIASLHPSIKGVDGAQTAGASIVSFNLKSSESYGKIQGDNSPISEQATFAYTTALNYLLRRDSHNHQRLKIGDATVVFWAQARSSVEATQAESFLAYLMSPSVSDESETDKLRSTLEAISKGKPLKEINPELDPESHLFVLGLSPNASRLSIRFWEHNSLKVFSERIAQHYEDLILEPTPWQFAPSVWRLLLETVPHREGSKPKIEDVQPQLNGELMRAILTGSSYPRSLLTNLIMRMRADGDISSLRVALCKAVLAREARKGVITQQEALVSLDPDNTDPGYLLGRLFSTLENIQRAALGSQVNTTIKDRYFGAASATPASVFPVLVRNSQHHLARLRKDKYGLATTLERELGEIVDRLGTTLPRSLRIEAQGRFAIGYYHQTQSRFKKPELSEEGDSV